MNRILAIGALIVGLIDCYPTSAADLLKSKVETARTDKPRLIFYPETCAEDAYNECAVLVFECENVMDVTIMTGGFNDAELVEWINKFHKIFYLQIDKRIIKYHPTKIGEEDYDGSWWISGRISNYDDGGRKLWHDLWWSRHVKFVSGKQTLNLPTDQFLKFSHECDKKAAKDDADHSAPTSESPLDEERLKKSDEPKNKLPAN